MKKSSITMMIYLSLIILTSLFLGSFDNSKSKIGATAIEVQKTNNNINKQYDRTSCDDDQEQISADSSIGANKCDLDIHNNEKPIYSIEEVNCLINNGAIEYKRIGRNNIDSPKYVSKIIDGQTDLNSIEAKSFIYHQMINSIDNFTNAEGSLTLSLAGAPPADIHFQTNLKNGTSYERLEQSSLSESEFYVESGIRYSVHGKDKRITTDHIALSTEYTISDNDRVILLSNGENMTIVRDDLTYLKYSGSNCVFPQLYAMSDLFDFDSWSVTGTSYKFGRPCAVIEAKGDKKRYCYTIDLYTGIMINYEELDNNNTIIGYIRVNELSVDEGVCVKMFDESKYTTELGYTFDK